MNLNFKEEFLIRQDFLTQYNRELVSSGQSTLCAKRSVKAPKQLQSYYICLPGAHGDSMFARWNACLAIFCCWYVEVLYFIDFVIIYTSKCAI